MPRYIVKVTTWLHVDADSEEQAQQRATDAVCLDSEKGGDECHLYTKKVEELFEAE